MKSELKVIRTWRHCEKKSLLHSWCFNTFSLITHEHPVYFNVTRLNQITCLWSLCLLCLCYDLIMFIIKISFNYGDHLAQQNQFKYSHIFNVIWLFLFEITNLLHCSIMLQKYANKHEGNNWKEQKKKKPKHVNNTKKIHKNARTK